ncbi:MAG: diacylglycerol kinase family protein [Planctomycetota bacterium]
MPRPGPSFWTLRRARFADAGRGALHVLTREVHGRLHLLAATVVFTAAALLGVPPAHWALLIVAVGAVLTAEAINSALEQLADALHPGHHPGIGRAKDMAAGAVLLAAITACVLGGFVFVPALLR